MQKKDTTKPARTGSATATKPAPDYSTRAAERLIDFFDDGDIPDFITTAAQEALEQAAAHHRINVWRAADLPSKGHLFDAAAVARLIEATRMYSPPDGELPELLAAVLSHPDLPDCLEEAIGEGLNDVFNNLPNRRWKLLEYSSTYISLLLSTHKEGGRDEG